MAGNSGNGAAFEFMRTMKILLGSEMLRLTPRCPECGTKMKKCIANESGKPFWGCSRFPRCAGYKGMRRSARWRSRVEKSLAQVNTWLEQMADVPGQE